MQAVAVSAWASMTHCMMGLRNSNKYCLLCSAAALWLRSLPTKAALAAVSGRDLDVA